MHFEILVEDISGKVLLSAILPKLLGKQNDSHSWRVHSYRGIGRIPRNLKSRPDPFKKTLLDKLPSILKGYGNTPGVDAVVIVLDSDSRNCVKFLSELNDLLESCKPKPSSILFRLAIEEIEAWYLGDRPALREAYPRAKFDRIKSYQQDSICGTWELLADVIYKGGSSAIKKAGWPLPGQLKHERAMRIGPFLDIDQNESPSFRKMCSGFRRLIES